MKQKESLKEKEEKIAKLREALPEMTTENLDQRKKQLEKQIRNLETEVC